MSRIRDRRLARLFAGQKTCAARSLTLSSNKWRSVANLFLGSKMRKATTLAVLSQLIAAGYLQLVEWVDLFPWNDLSKGNQQEVLDVALLAGQGMVAFWFVRQRLILMCLGWLSYAFWMYLQIVSWWRPYLFGNRVVGPNWYFAKAYKFLPQIDQRPTPDADHVVLQLLLLAVLISGAIAIWRSAIAARRPKTQP